MNRQTTKQWWSERSQNQKALIIFGIIFLLGMLGGMPTKNNSAPEASNNYEQPSSKYTCPVCYEGFSHAGYRNIGTRTYCSERCYVDGGGT